MHLFPNLETSCLNTFGLSAWHVCNLLSSVFAHEPQLLIHIWITTPNAEPYHFWEGDHYAVAADMWGASGLDLYWIPKTLRRENGPLWSSLPPQHPL
jgi:hypothetical protein